MFVSKMLSRSWKCRGVGMRALKRYMASDRGEVFPVVDVGQAVAGQIGEDAVEDLDEAFINHGFAYIKNHGVDERLLLGIRDCGRDFFAQPDHIKATVAIGMPGGDDNNLGRGYQRLGLNVTKGMRDAHEALDFYRELPENHQCLRDLVSTDHAPLVMGRNPRLGEHFDATVALYAESMERLGHTMVKLMDSALARADVMEGSELSHLMDDSFWGFRVIGYPHLESSGVDEEGISCGEHTDYGLLTFVNQDNVAGALQVRSVDGEWLDANDIEGCLVVNIGDMAARASKGRWVSTPHRVMNRGATFRVSAPFFFEPRYTAKVDGLMYGDHLLGKVTSNFKY